MADGVSVEAKGIKEIMQMFNGLPKRVNKDLVWGRFWKKVTKPMLTAAEANAPLLKPPSRKDVSYPPDKSQTIAKILLMSGLVISIIVNWFTTILLGCIYLVWGIMYNQKPFNWKMKPILGWFSNSIVGVLLFMIGWYLVITNQLNNNEIFLNISCQPQKL